MADTTVKTSPPPPPPRKRHGFLRFVAWFLCIFIILLVGIYFLATSSAFVKGVIVPRAGKAMNSDITVSDAKISPFKEVYLKDLKVTPHGQETLVTAPEVRVKYKLMDIVRGNIDVDEITLASPTVTLVENPDGSSNLDPITQSQKPKSEKEKEKEKKSSKPTQLDLKKFALTDATIRQVKLYKNGNRDTTELSHVNITADNLKNGQTGNLAISADVKVEKNPPAPGTNGTLEAKIKGAFKIALSPDLKPSSIQGNTHVDVSNTAGGFAEMAGLGTDLDCDVTPTDVKQVALRFSKANSQLGQVRVFGPFDMEKTEGKLTVEVLSIDKQVLNLAGAGSGLDFGPTKLNSTNQIELTKGGSVITAMGRLMLDKLQVTRAKQTTPTLDFAAQYSVTVDRSANNATLRELTLNGVENSKQLLHGELTSPMSFSWGNAQTQMGDSTLNIVLTQLNLADWKPFIGDNVSSGTVNGKLQLLSQQVGKLLTFDLGAQIENLTAKSGSNEISQATVIVVAKGRANNLEKFDLSECSAKLNHQNQTVFAAVGAGTYNKTAETADMQLTVNSSLPQLVQVVRQPDVSFSSGTLELKARVVQQKKTVSLTGNLALNDLTGKSGKNTFQNYQTAMDLDIGKTPDVIQIRRANGKLSQGGQAGGSFDISGTISTNNGTQITARLTDFNQNGLRPFLEPLLAGKQLVSVALNGTADTRLSPQGDSTVKADFKVANLVVKDPTNPAPAQPLEAAFQVDASVQKKVADLRQCALTLTQTDRAKNQLQITGKVDMSQTNAYQGNLKVAADALDVTRHYDLFAGQPTTSEQQKGAKTTPAKPTPAPETAPAAGSATATTSGAEKEPEAMHLPFRNFTADVNIGRFYLREVEITNLQTTAKIEGSHVVLNPFKLALNGAPVDANVDLDLGVAGYKYDTAFNMQAVPLTPLVNSFEPDRKGQIGGTLTAQAKVSGAGITGASLKKNLNGNFDINSTNLNYAIDKVKQPVIKLIVNVVGSVPDLIHNPIGTAGALVGDIVGIHHGGLTDELQKSPIQGIIAKGTAGSGRINLQQAAVTSAAFRADASGTVMLADVLTNSPINMPVNISLSQDAARRFGVGGSDTNAAFVKMPDFLLIGGTIGKPTPDKRKLLVLGTSALGGIANAIPGGDKYGGLLQGASSLLGGNKSGQGTGTNAPANAGSNQPTGRNDLLQGINSVFGGQKTTNTNAPASTNQTNQSSTNKGTINNLLNDFLKPK